MTRDILASLTPDGDFQGEIEDALAQRIGTALGNIPSAATRLVYNGTAYPARPDTAELVTWVGPASVPPTGMVLGDLWAAEASA